jgi:hypothetical protein
MDKPLEEMRRGIGLHRFHVPGTEYAGDRPNLNWPRFLLHLQNQGSILEWWSNGWVWPFQAPRLRTMYPTVRRAS